MAGTYYGYKERDNSLNLNWAEIGSDLTKGLTAEAEDRERRKAEIDENTRQTLKTINETPKGESTSLREWGITYSDEAQKNMLMNERLLKSGLLNPSDYTKVRQNISDGTDQVFSMLEEYQNVYADKMERMKSNDPANQSQDLEVWLMENVEGYANLSASVPVFDKSGRLSLGKMVRNEKTGKMELDKSPNSLRSVSALQGQIAGKYDRYQLDANSQAWVDTKGEWVEIVREFGTQTKSGRIMSITNPLFGENLDEEGKEKLKSFNKALDSYVESQISNPYNITSILTHNSDNEYSFTFDPKEAEGNPNMILLESDEHGRPTPSFTKKQIKEAKEIIKTDVLNKIDSKETERTVRDVYPSRSSGSNKNGRGYDPKKTITSMANLWKGSNEDVQSATTYFRDAMGLNVDDIKRTPQGVTVTFTDKSGEKQIKELPFTNKDGSIMSQEKWIESAYPLLTGGRTDLNKALQESRYNPEGVFNETADSKAVTKGEDFYDKEVSSKINTLMEDDAFRKGGFGNRSDKPVKMLQEAFPNLNIKYDGDKLTFDGAEQDLIVDLSPWTDKGMAEAMSQVKDWLMFEMTYEQKEEAISNKPKKEEGNKTEAQKKAEEFFKKP